MNQPSPQASATMLGEMRFVWEGDREAKRIFKEESSGVLGSCWSHEHCAIHLREDLTCWESWKTPILLLCHLGWGWVQSLDTAFRTSLKSCRLLFPLRLVCSGLPLCQQSSSPCVGDGEITELAAYPFHCHQCPQQGVSAPVTFSTEAACAALLHTCSSYNCEEWPGLCNQE